MLIRRTVQFSFTLILLIAMAGCQSNPIEPGVGHDVELLQNSQNHNCLGLYTLVVDTADLTVQVIPLRSSDLHLNVTGILNATMGISVAGVPSESDPVNGYIVLDITLEHPFATKPQLSGLDVKGILITPGSLAVGSLLFADTDETRLVNADGYTRWWNPTEFTSTGMFGYIQGILANAGAPQLTATVNPYKLFADVLEATDSLSWVSGTPLDDDEGRAVFRAGSSNTRRYQIQFPMDPGPQIVYGYAVDASWNVPSPNPPLEIPDDFPYSANMPEPYRVVLQPTANSLYYDTESGMHGGVLRLQVNVHDWQGMTTGDIAAEVSSVRIYSPGLFGAVDAVFLDQSLEKARYTCDLLGIASPSAAGETLVATRVQSATGPLYDQGLGHPAPASTVSAWQALVLDVIDPSCEADSNNALAEAEEIGLTGNVTDELCDSVDMEDWYWFEIPAGYEVSGEVRWYTDADTCELGLYDADGDYIQGSYNMIDYLVIDLDSTWLPPGTFYLQAIATQVGNPPPAGIAYLLETDLELIDVQPANPVDVTPERWDCGAHWVGSQHDNESWLVMTGAAGTWGYSVDGAGFGFQGRTYDGFGGIPGYYHPYLYIWDYPSGGTVDLIDYTAIYAPVKHESVLALGDQIEAMVMNSIHLYIAVDEGSNSFLRVYDYATDPTQPVYLGGLIIDHNISRLELLDPEGPNTVLVTMTGDEMRCWDVEDPTSILLKDTELNVNTTNADMGVTGDYIVKTHVDIVSDGYLIVYKWDDLTGLENWGYAALSSWGNSVCADGVYAYVANNDQGIDVYNFTVKNTFIHTANVPVQSPAWYIHATDNWLLSVQDGPGVVLYDRSSPGLPVEQANTHCLNTPFDVEIKDDYMFFVEGVSGYGTITAIRNNDPPSENIAKEFPLEDVATLIAGYGGLLAVGSSAANKIWIYDYTTNPLVLNELYSDTITGNITAMDMTDQGLYVSLDTGLLNIYDTTLAPIIFSKPALVLPDGDPITYFAFDIDKNYAYTPRYQSTKFDIYNLSDPWLWSHVSNTILADDTRAAEVLNEYLYVLTTDMLDIRDQSDPANLVWQSSPIMPYPGNMAFMDVEGQYAYVSDQGSAVQVVSLYPPDASSVTGYTIPTPEAITTEIKVHDGLLYVLKYFHGVHVYDLY